jgi:hypothetical protein
MQSANILETGGAALLFCVIFLAGGRIHPLRIWIPDRRSLVSFSAGMAAAYVFVHVMPELHAVRQVFAESVSVELRYEGMAIYFLALIGFLLFYGLDHLRARLRESAEADDEALAFKLHVGGFAAYVWLMAYLLVQSLEETTVSTALYAIAIAFHFLAVDHSLRHEHGAAYERSGRFLLAGMSIFGWAVGLLVVVPMYFIALLTAFLSGAIIMNSTIMELPSERDGRFWPFIVGGVVYGLILIPLG